MALIFRTSNTANAGVNYIKNSPLTYTEGDGNLAWLATNMSGSSINVRSGGNIDTYATNGTINLFGKNGQFLQIIASGSNADQYQSWYDSGISTRRGYFGYSSANNVYLHNETASGSITILTDNRYVGPGSTTGGTGTVDIIAGIAGGVRLSNGAASWGTVSDERLKTDLVPITNATNKVSQLRAVTGRYKTDEVGKSRSFLIAQDVLSVLPEAVDISNDELNTLGLRYTEVIPLLVAAIKELKAEIDILKAK